MTLPNMPFDSTDPDSLPQGVVAPSQLATALQDHTKDKFNSLAAGRFPPVVSSTSAGDPADNLGPLGFIVELFAKLTEDVANADPATIQGPDDLQPLIHDFFQGLPIIGFFVDLLDAMQGTYDGDDPVLDAIADLVKILRDFADAALQALGGDFQPMITFVDDLLDPPEWLSIEGWTKGAFALLQDIEDQIAFWLHKLADLLDLIPIVGDDLASIVDQIADSMNTTNTKADGAHTKADTAAADALNAQIAANAASTNAATALSTANIKTKTTRATAAPSSPGVGDLWADNSLGDTKVLWKVWDGAVWQLTTDKVATETQSTVTNLSTGSVLDTFTTGGTWTKRAGVKRVREFVFGGGGGGGASGGTLHRIGTGGGIGGYTFREIDASALGATETVVVGSGGTGGVANGGNGNGGNPSSFATDSAGGGGAGLGNQLNTVLAPGKAGFGTETAFVTGIGGGSGGSQLADGFDGSSGSFTPGGAGNTSGAGGNGTSPPTGKIGLGSSGGGGDGASAANAGGSGAAPGGGGGGASSGSTTTGTFGGAGGAGRVFIENLYS